MFTSRQSPEQEVSQLSMKLNKYARKKFYKKVQISSKDSSSKERQGDSSGPINLLACMESRNWLSTEVIKSILQYPAEQIGYWWQLAEASVQGLQGTTVSISNLQTPGFRFSFCCRTFELGSKRR